MGGPPAHPRSRGENQGDAYTCVGELGSSPLTRGKHGGELGVGRGGGSSPLTRGKHLPADRRETLRRLIPAHAGKTALCDPHQRRFEAHPRSRGENLMPGRYVVSVAGSSPLTRGKPPVVGETRCRDGLIPAHAGKTVSPSSISLLMWAHPRSRGENIKAAAAVVAEWGSSPLTRGKRLCDAARP